MDVLDASSLKFPENRDNRDSRDISSINDRVRRKASTNGVRRLSGCGIRNRNSVLEQAVTIHRDAGLTRRERIASVGQRLHD